MPLSTIRIDGAAADAVDRIAGAVRAAVRRIERVAPATVVLCIGTDRSTGDCLGPLVGSRLIAAGWSTSPGTPLGVRGSLDFPVHAANLSTVISELESGWGRPLLVAVDACLGSLENVGTVTVGRGPLRPGTGVNKSLPAVGDIHLTGVVNVGGFMEYLVLQNTRLHLVMRMADAIAGGLRAALEPPAFREAAADAIPWALPVGGDGGRRPPLPPSCPPP